MRTTKAQISLRIRADQTYANNKGTEHTAQPRSLISAFVQSILRNRVVWSAPLLFAA